MKKSPLKTAPKKDTRAPSPPNKKSPMARAATTRQKK